MIVILNVGEYCCFRIFARTHIQTHVCMSAHTFVYPITTHTQARTQHTNVHKHAYKRIHARAHTHTHIQTYIHTYIHTRGERQTDR